MPVAFAAELDEGVDALLLPVELALLLPEPEGLALVCVAEALPGAVSVTPTEAHDCCAKASAAARSLPEQVLSMHVVVLCMNCWFVHRHWLSVAEQPPRSALPMHVKAHCGTFCRETRKAEATPAKSRVMVKRILSVVFV